MTPDVAGGCAAGAAASLREGLEETVTAPALGITGALYRMLRTTNPLETLNETHVGCIEGLVRARRTGRTQGRVASRLRSRHLAAFNGVRDIARSDRSQIKRVLAGSGQGLLPMLELPEGVQASIDELMHDTAVGLAEQLLLL